MSILTRVVLGSAVALGLTACTTDAGQPPMIIAATAVQVEPVESPAEGAADSPAGADAAEPEAMVMTTDAEELAGVPTVHYRVDNAEEFGALVADAFGGRAGALTAITLDDFYYTARREDLALVFALAAGEDGQPTQVEVFAEPRE